MSDGTASVIQGLKGEEIRCCRNFAVADAFDAMTNDRPLESNEPESNSRVQRNAGHSLTWM